MIAESLRRGTELEGLGLRLARLRRVEVDNAVPGQPEVWTLIDFESEEALAEPIALALSESLDPIGAWYVNYSTATEVFVVFPGQAIRYELGDEIGRAKAEALAREIGVPESRLDWKD
ncbi:hypothetical protein GCM10028833_40160 [Glycomyces tarimensis]